MKFLSSIGFVALILVLAACGTASSPPVNSSSSTPKVVLNGSAINSIIASTQSGNFHDPLDSIPDANGTTIYFTATGPHGKGVFQVPATGGAAKEVFTGSPFVAPRGLELSFDGKQIYVADLSAGDGGEIFTLPIGGGTPSPVRGSAKAAPQNLYLVNKNGQQTIYFTGKDPSSGQPAVLTLPIGELMRPVSW